MNTDTQNKIAALEALMESLQWCLIKTIELKQEMQQRSDSAARVKASMWGSVNHYIANIQEAHSAASWILTEGQTETGQPIWKK